jgi:hypothetical protein
MIKKISVIAISLVAFAGIVFVGTLLHPQLASVNAAISDEASFNPPPVQNGSLKVCVIMTDKNGDIIHNFRDTVVGNTTFTIPITVHENGVARVIKNATFTTSDFSTNTNIINTETGNDADCVSYSLPIDDYYYRRETISGDNVGKWAKALYNDEFTGRVEELTICFHLELLMMPTTPLCFIMTDQTDDSLF